MHDKHYVADIVINHGIDNPALFSVEPYTRLCLGLEWALLRQPFIEASSKNRKKKYSSEIKTVAVSFGGADSYRLTDQLIEMLVKNIHIQKIDAIVGEEYRTLLPLSSLDRVTFHRSVPAHEIVNILSGCDLAVLSASTVCIEALACNARVAAGYYVDNQKEFYQRLDKAGRIYGLGDLLKSGSLELLNNSEFIYNNLPKYSALDLSTLSERFINLFKTEIQ
jgi:spore coat polysaccharide biosynthesis predicted glycosyltransferase SpsG